MRHTLAEGWLLLRQRALISFILACALATPISLAGLTLSVSRWLGPVIATAQQGGDTVAVLLHPHLEEAERTAWLARQAEQHPEWTMTRVSPDQLIERLTHWFPYLEDLFEDDAVEMLPPLVEIATSDPESVAELGVSPQVLAVGPRSSLHHAAAQVATRIGWLLGLVAAVLLASAILLAAVWVHLELYRHADEITIMRLIGATESAIRGPFLVAVVAPGVIAAMLSVAATLLLAVALSEMIATLGLPPLAVPRSVIGIQVVVAFLLPLAAAAITLSRHARLKLREPDV
jgi:cell division transport system permease protein